MKLINFQLVTPEKVVLTTELTALSCPTTEGEITILPNHIPLVTQIQPGEIHAKTKDDEFFMFVSGGFLQVQKDNKVIILADAAEHHFEISEQRAEEARQRAEKALKEVKAGNEEYAKVAASLEKSLARIRIAKKRASRKTKQFN